MKSRFHSLFPVITIIVLWFLFSAPYVLKGLVPFPSTYLVTNFPPWSAQNGMPVKNDAMPDVITQIMPWKMLSTATWKNGEIPLWNPYSFSGTLHAGNYQTAVFTLLGILFILLPFIDAWSILILLQPLLAGLFMYLFLRELKCTFTALVIGSAGFMFSGFLVTWMAYGTLGYAILFLPLILWSVRRFIHTGCGWVFVVGMLGTTCSFLSGHFQISLYAAMSAMLFCVFEMKGEKEIRRGVLSFCMIALGIGIAAPQILITLTAFQESVRQAYTQMQEVIPWNYLVTFLSPDFYGNPVTRNNWYGHYAEWSGYIGIVPLMLSGYGIYFFKKREKYFFFGLFLLSLLFSYASPLSSLLFVSKVPVLSTSAASRMIVISSFSLCVLAALGCMQIMDDWRMGIWKRWLCVFLTFVFFVGIIWMVLLFGKPFPQDWMFVAKRNFMLSSIYIFVCGSAGFFGYIRKITIRHIAICIILLLCCFDAYRFSSKWMPFDPREYVFPENSMTSYLSEVIGTQRAFGNIGNEAGSTFGIPLIEGYDAMYQGRYGEFIQSSFDGIVSIPPRSVVQLDKNGTYIIPTLQLLGVKYIVHRLSDMKNVWAFPYWHYDEGMFTSVFRNDHYEIFAFRDAYPRTFLASGYVLRKEKQEIIDALFDKDLDRRDVLILEEKPDIEPQKGEGTAEIIVYTSSKIAIQTSASVPKLLFLSDIFTPGWQAFIDGVRANILRADYDFRAVSVPAGNHRIEFRYQPLEFRIGILIAILSLCAGAGVVFLSAGKRKHL